MHTTYGFGDVRLDRRGEIMTEQIVATGSLVLRRLGGERSEELAAGRFLASPKVTPEAIIDTHASSTAVAARGRRVVAAQDTTEINFSGRAHRRKGLGPAGDGKSPGFFIHAVVAVDADREDLVGVVGAHAWTRPPGKRRWRQMQPVEAKETKRWIDGAERAGTVLADAAEVVTVEDREGDFYARLARNPAGQHAIIRARHNRKLAEGGVLFAVADDWPDLGTAAIKVPPRGPGDKGRTAKVAIRANGVTIAKPKAKVRTPDPETLQIGLVEVREIDPPPQVKPVVWRLLTTLPTATLKEAEDVVRLYRLRWRIEQVFRALKSDGLALEETQVAEAGRLFKLAAMGLVAAVRILQLVDARDGSDRPASDVIDPALLAPAAAIGQTLEGRTERQRNPHPKGTLGWLSWIVARLGGWNCYYKPPGPKTMAIGWPRLAAMISGFVIATPDLQVYGLDV
jgi:Transposase DDE domain